MLYPMARADLHLDVPSHLAQGQIVGAAVGVFTRLGFAATRVEDLLAAAGIARRTFYKYFRSKEEVLAAVYELATGELLKAIRGGVEGSASTANAGPLEAMRRALDVYLDYHVDNAPLLRVLVEQAIRSDSPLAPLRRRFRGDLVALMDAGVRVSTGATHDPMLYAALLSALEGLSLDLLASGSPPADVRRAKRVMHHLLAKCLSG
jgi:AcrR family transcriptional regulator